MKGQGKGNLAAAVLGSQGKWPAGGGKGRHQGQAGGAQRQIRGIHPPGGKWKQDSESTPGRFLQRANNNLHLSHNYLCSKIERISTLIPHLILSRALRFRYVFEVYSIVVVLPN